MLIGIYLAFFSSHRRIWLTFTINQDSVQAVFAGTSTKNKETFSETFNDLFEKLKTTGKTKC
jgi:cytochrome c biogenesis protein